MIVNVGGRTDIVNYYSEWLINRIKEGYAYSRNPLFTNNISKISLKPEDVDCLMFCSKNYKPMLKYMKEINQKYRIICHYTITAYGRDVEPNVPDIDESIKTLFVEMYKKLDYNMPEIIPFTDEDKIQILEGIGRISKKYNLYTQTCGTDENYEKYGIHLSGCTTTEILEQANNVKYKNIKAKGMRKGCHCIPSRDIGAYDTCLNGCKYCYANKRPDLAKENAKLHDKNSPLLIGNVNKTDKITIAKQESFIKEYNVEKAEQISLI